MSQLLENVWIGLQVAGRLCLWLLIAVVAVMIAASLVIDWKDKH